jgi:hypothetical protein
MRLHRNSKKSHQLRLGHPAEPRTIGQSHGHLTPDGQLHRDIGAELHHWCQRALDRPGITSPARVVECHPSSISTALMRFQKRGEIPFARAVLVSCRFGTEKFWGNKHIQGYTGSFALPEPGRNISPKSSAIFCTGGGNHRNQSIVPKLVVSRCCGCKLPASLFILHCNLLNELNCHELFLPL